MVEIDPANPEDPGTKHTSLGRFRHEAVAVQARAGEPLHVYSGCDRRGGHLYRFLSDDIVSNPSDPANSRLLRKAPSMEPCSIPMAAAAGWRSPLAPW